MNWIKSVFSILALLYSISVAAEITNSSYLSIKNHIDSNIYIGPLAYNDDIGTIAGTSHITHPNQELLAYARIACKRNYSSPSPCMSSSYPFWTLWEPNPFVPAPYLGISCHILTTASYGCDKTGKFPLYYIQGALYPQTAHWGVRSFPGFRNYGFMSQPYGFIAGAVSTAYLEKLHNVPTGNQVSITQQFCAHKSANVVLPTLPCDYQETNTLNYKKAGTLTLMPIKQKNNIFVDSNGTPTLLPGSTGCEQATVAGVNGLVCEISSYNFETQGWPSKSPFNYAIRINNAALNAKVAVEDIKISADKVTWTGKEVTQPLDTLQGRKSIYIFLSKKYFKALNDTGLLGSDQQVLRFSIFHSEMTASGYYEFSPSVQFDVKSRYYSVFITPESGSYAEGKVGYDRLVFPYKLAESGPVSASRLEMRVTQDTGTVFKGFCTLYQGNSAIPVPTRLVFNSESLGDNYLQPIRCDATPIDLRSFQIKDSRPPEYWQGQEGDGVTRYYDVALDFDLRHPMVFETTAGEPWEGIAAQTGKIELRAIWN
ncbi:hypothetical protein [Aeromonas sp. 604176]|uniref:hypothetical protein n=1 Tax=Aeromonas sp. 604176 TaxID=2712052 RepID=UPI003BA2627F